MSLNNTPSSERIHIGIFGKRNAGKSSLINALTNQDLAVVSDVKGTTTDPVSKAMELLPLGPVVLIDTPGIDDEGELGKLRIKKSYQVLNKTDIALLVIDAADGISPADLRLINRIEDKQIPLLIAINKCDLCNPDTFNKENIPANIPVFFVSAFTKTGIHELKEAIARQVPEQKSEYPVVSDLINSLDFVVLVVPVDKAAPKGRLILPQQQTIRDLLERGAVSIVVRDTELKDTLQKLNQKPALVITDSQAFKQVSAVVPEDVLLTSFSILFARHRGSLTSLIKGVSSVKNLKENDKVLICEGCTHHRQCNDIGTVKIPKLLTASVGHPLSFEYTSGTAFPDDLSEYKLIIHCGGCMLNEREMKYRIACAEDAGIPITNYGILLANLNGILKRSLQVFPDIQKLL